MELIMGLLEVVAVTLAALLTRVFICVSIVCYGDKKCSS